MRKRGLIPGTSATAGTATPAELPTSLIEDQTRTEGPADQWTRGPRIRGPEQRMGGQKRTGGCEDLRTAGSEELQYIHTSSRVYIGRVPSPLALDQAKDKLEPNDGGVDGQRSTVECTKPPAPG